MTILSRTSTHTKPLLVRRCERMYKTHQIWTAFAAQQHTFIPSFPELVVTSIWIVAPTHPPSFPLLIQRFNRLRKICFSFNGHNLVLNDHAPLSSFCSLRWSTDTRNIDIGRFAKIGILVNGGFESTAVLIVGRNICYFPVSLNRISIPIFFFFFILKKKKNLSLVRV